MHLNGKVWDLEKGRKWKFQRRLQGSRSANRRDSSDQGDEALRVSVVVYFEVTENHYDSQSSYHSRAERGGEIEWRY